MNNLLVKGESLNGRSGHEAGRQLLQRMYRETAGEPLPEIRITQRGKPEFVDSVWHFSISHTPRHVFCALATSPVGLDAEETDRRIRPELAEKILSPTEMKRYTAAADKNACLLRLWILKEAEAKRTGEGLRGYPNHTDFSPEDPRIRVMNGCYVAVII